MSRVDLKVCSVGITRGIIEPTSSRGCYMLCARSSSCSEFGDGECCRYRNQAARNSTKQEYFVILAYVCWIKLTTFSNLKHRLKRRSAGFKHDYPHNSPTFCLQPVKKGKTGNWWNGCRRISADHFDLDLQSRKQSRIRLRCARDRARDLISSVRWQHLLMSKLSKCT